MAESTADAADRGGLRIADRVVIRVAQHAAAQVPGVALASGAGISDRLGGGRRPRASCERAGTRAVIAVDLAVTWPCSTLEVAARVQREVAHEVEQLAGLSVDAVRVIVSDVVSGSGPSKARVR